MEVEDIDSVLDDVVVKVKKVVVSPKVKVAELVGVLEEAEVKSVVV